MRALIKLIVWGLMSYFMIKLMLEIFYNSAVAKYSTSKEKEEDLESQCVQSEIYQKVVDYYRHTSSCVDNGQVPAIAQYAKDAHQFVLNRSHKVSDAVRDSALKVIDQINYRSQNYQRNVFQPTRVEKEKFKLSIRYLWTDITKLRPSDLDRKVS